VSDLGKSAGKKFDEGLYCAESVLAAIGEHRGIQSDLIPGIATGFCSGLARTSGTCGAVSGGVMGIGLVTGRSAPEEDAVPTYERVQEFLQRFRERFGSLNCYELTGCDLATEEGRRRFDEENLAPKCREFVVAATEEAAALLKRDSWPDGPANR